MINFEPWDDELDPDEAEFKALMGKIMALKIKAREQNKDAD